MTLLEMFRGYSRQYKAVLKARHDAQRDWTAAGFVDTILSYREYSARIDE